MVNNDKLDKIFAMQKELDDFIADRRDLPEVSIDEWVKRLTFAMVEELTEVANEANFKWWKNSKPIDKQAITEEMADVLHFYASLCIRLGISTDELFEAYKNKNAENIRRQKGETDRQGYNIEETEK